MDPWKTLGAYTAPEGSFPPYINASEDADGRVRVIVRGTGYPDGRGNFVMGNEASILMPREAFKRWLGEVVSELVIAGCKCDDATREVIRKAVTSAVDEPAPKAKCTFVLPGPGTGGLEVVEARKRTFVLPGYDERVEAHAKEIYDGFAFDEVGDKPAWVDGGNSLKQDEARALARASVPKLPVPGDD